MQSISLNGSWQFLFKQGCLLEDVRFSDFTAADIMCVPGAFDAMPDYFGKRGTALYRRTFCLENDVKNAFVLVDGMGLRCKFFIDDREIGYSCMPWSYLEFETGPLSAGVHTISAAVDNNFHSERMKLFNPNFDFYAFGGFWHGIELKLQNESTELDRMLIRTLDYRTGEISVEFLFKGEAPESFFADISFDYGKAEQVEIKNCYAEFQVPDFKLWSPESPALHFIKAKVNNSAVTERFGIRCIETARKKILLNGKEIYLKGFNRHESHAETGAATPETVMVEDLQNMRALHCNFVRGAHYPQSRRFLDLCDEFGIMVWEEGIGWGIGEQQMSDPEFIELQKQQAALMVRNSFNHPSVIIWAFLNEHESDSEAGKFLTSELIRVIKAENSGRLITFACSRTNTDISNVETDLIAYNTYPYWIDNAAVDDNMGQQMLANQEKILAYFRQKYGEEKPIIIGEMGCCGVYGHHDRGAAQWTEEFQAEYLENVIKTVFSSDEICGITLWQFTDCKSYSRSGCILRVKPFAQNLAGVYDGFRRPKLAAAVVEKLFNQVP